MQTIWLDFSLAFRNVVRQRRRSAVAIGAVAFGITALILASGFIEWIFMDFRESTIRSQLGHLQIVKPGYHDAGKADPYAFLLPDSNPEKQQSSGLGNQGYFDKSRRHCGLRVFCKPTSAVRPVPEVIQNALLTAQARRRAALIRAKVLSPCAIPRWSANVS